jgi:hypothetical protein
MAYCREPDNTRERKAPHDQLRRIVRPRPTTSASPKTVYKQMSGRCKVSRQTEIIIDQLEELQLRSRKRQAEPPKGKPARRRRDLARYLYPTPRRGKRE